MCYLCLAPELQLGNCVVERAHGALCLVQLLLGLRIPIAELVEGCFAALVFCLALFVYLCAVIRLDCHADCIAQNNHANCIAQTNT